jgi:hypothetical protein
MTGKQNFIFFFGMFVIILNFYFSGAFHKLSIAVFGGNGWASPATAKPSAGSSGSSGGFSIPSFNPFPLGFTIPGTPIRIPIP